MCFTFHVKFFPGGCGGKGERGITAGNGFSIESNGNYLQIQKTNGNDIIISKGIGI